MKYSDSRWDDLHLYILEFKMFKNYDYIKYYYSLELYNYSIQIVKAYF